MRRSDDLQEIEGIGPITARALDQAGIRTFEALARCTERELADLLRERVGVSISEEAIKRSAWIEAARARTHIPVLPQRFPFDRDPRINVVKEQVMDEPIRKADKESSDSTPNHTAGETSESNRAHQSKHREYSVESENNEGPATAKSPKRSKPRASRSQKPPKSGKPAPTQKVSDAEKNEMDPADSEASTGPRQADTSAGATPPLARAEDLDSGKTPTPPPAAPHGLAIEEVSFKVRAQEQRNELVADIKITVPTDEWQKLPPGHETSLCLHLYAGPEGGTVLQPLSVCTLEASRPHLEAHIEAAVPPQGTYRLWLVAYLLFDSWPITVHQGPRLRVMP